MKTYSIQMNTVKDFRSYVNFICRFGIAGYVLVDGCRENMYDILDVISHGHLDDMKLMLTVYRKADLPAIETYLKETGLWSKKPRGESAA